jgi:hypothetical protein
VTDRLNVTVANGKYTYVQREDGSSTALRYGGNWPAFDMAPPDNLHHALAAEVQALRDGLQAIVDRADNGELGTSKVMDMRRIAADLLTEASQP